MAKVSRQKAILTAIKAVLLAHSELSTYNWRIRKRAYNRGNTWSAGGWICYAPYSSDYHENSLDEIVFQAYVVIVQPSNGDLEAADEEHAAALEIAFDLFHNKSNSYLPGAIKDLNTDVRFASGPYKMAITMTDATVGALFDPTAFEQNFDVSGITVMVRARVPRLDATSLR